MAYKEEAYQDPRIEAMRRAAAIGAHVPGTVPDLGVADRTSGTPYQTPNSSYTPPRDLRPGAAQYGSTPTGGNPSSAGFVPTAAQQAEMQGQLDATRRANAAPVTPTGPVTPAAPDAPDRPDAPAVVPTGGSLVAPLPVPGALTGSLATPTVGSAPPAGLPTSEPAQAPIISQGSNLGPKSALTNAAPTTPPYAPNLSHPGPVNAGANPTGQQWSSGIPGGVGGPNDPGGAGSGISNQAPAGGDLSSLTTNIMSQLQEIQASISAPNAQSDVTGVYLQQSQAILKMLDEQEARLRSENEAQGTTLDPATQFTISQLRKTLEENLKSTRSNLNSRGLYESGIALELENRLQKGSQSDEAGLLANRLSKLQEDLNQGLTGIRNSRTNTMSEFGMGAANAQFQHGENETQNRLSREQSSLQGMMQLRGQQSGEQQHSSGLAASAQQHAAGLAANASESALDRAARESEFGRSTAAQESQFGRSAAANASEGALERAARESEFGRSTAASASENAAAQTRWEEEFGADKAKFNIEQTYTQNQDAQARADAMARAASGGARTAAPKAASGVTMPSSNQPKPANLNSTSTASVLENLQRDFDSGMTRDEMDAEIQASGAQMGAAGVDLAVVRNRIQMLFGD